MAKTQNQQKAGGKTGGGAGKGKKFKKRERKNVPYGLVYIQASFNNTIVTITDQTGNTLSWKSSAREDRCSSPTRGAAASLGLRLGARTVSSWSRSRSSL